MQQWPGRRAVLVGGSIAGALDIAFAISFAYFNGVPPQRLLQTENQRKHGVSFSLAQKAFLDSKRVIACDLAHSRSEERYYCFGSVGGGVLTVRFTYRNEVIRIIGAGYWRKGKRIYEQENQIHR